MIAPDPGVVHLPHHDRYPASLLQRILSKVRTIALVGASGDSKRPSYLVMKYLQKRGYRVIPVNPTRVGEEILGEIVHASLAEVPDRFEMVDVFRSSAPAAQVVDEAIAVKDDKGIQVVWMQLGVRNDAAAGKAEAAGLTVVMNRCPKIEFARLSGELGCGGVNT